MTDLTDPFKHLAYEIRLSRRYYAQSVQMVSWLWDNVGPGHAWELTGMHVHSDCAKWHMDRMFGQPIIRFKDEADLVQFKLTWC